MDIKTLNNQHGINQAIQFKNYHHTIVAEITTEHSTALISLYGAQVLSFTPKGEQDTLFMSSMSHFENGKAIRGGIPVCWPWFGGHPVDNTLPSHGFARISTWTVIKTEKVGDGIILSLGLSSNADTLKLWPYEFEAQIDILIGQELSVSLKTINCDNKSFEISSALHSYFNVSDINNIKLDGLANTSFLDDVEEKEGIQAEEQLLITDRIDRRYRQTQASCNLIDGDTTTQIAKQGSQITVVWNPGETLSQQMADLGDNDYRKMLCVEAANSLEDTITLKPGALHELKTIITRL